MNHNIVRTPSVQTNAGRPPVRRYAQLPRFFRWFSEHCVFRQLDDSDASRIWKAVLHPSFSRCWTGDLPRSADDVAEFVRGAQSDWLRGTRYVMTVLRKQTHDFVGWVELRATERKGTWLLDWFIHPDFVAGPMAQELLTGAADLMFSALEAQALFANCSSGYAHFERLLSAAGFVELVPAGSLDHRTGKPRRHALFQLGRCDWLAAHREQPGASTAPVGPSWAQAGKRVELALV